MTSSEKGDDVSGIARVIGRELQAARERCQHTQESLATASGVSRTVISKIERGRLSRLDLATYLALARELGVKTSWFAEQDVELDIFGLLGSEDEEEAGVVDLRNAETRGQNKFLLLVGGFAGSGKSTLGKALSEATRWPVIDKDTTARPMTEQFLAALGQDPNDRHGSVYLEQVRPVEYRTTLQAAFRQIECGLSAIVTAPFLLEMTSDSWVSQIDMRCSSLSCKPVYIWVDCDMETMRARVEQRGAARDGWKLANWEAYQRTVDTSMRPVVPHAVIDNRRNAAVSLAKQASNLAKKLENDS